MSKTALDYERALIEAAKKEARNEAIEECAQLAERGGYECDTPTAIRNLKEPQ